MATLWYDGSGNLLRLLRANDLPQSDSLVSAGSLSFDEASNPALVSAILSAWNGYRVANGALQLLGQVVAIVVPPAPLSASAVSANIQALSSAQQSALLNQFLGEQLLRDPALATRAGVSVATTAAPAPAIRID